MDINCIKEMKDSQIFNSVKRIQNQLNLIIKINKQKATLFHFNELRNSIKNQCKIFFASFESVFE